MKKLLGAAVLSGTVACAHAQSTVTLYGLMDEGLDFTNNANGSKAYVMDSGFIQGSRWGLKGEESLGAGLKALFQLENGFNVNNGKLGQSGRMFGRQAYVGIFSAAYGSIKLGRQYDSIVDYVSTLSGGILSHPYDNDNFGFTFRLQNTIKYTSPSFSGVQFGGTYSFSNDTNFANNRAFSAGANYSVGGLLVGIGYLQGNSPSSDTTGAIGDSFFGATRLRIFGGGAKYRFGSAAVGILYTDSYLQNPTSSVYVGAITPTGGGASSLRFQNFEINGKYDFTPFFNVGAMYNYTKATLSESGGKLKPNYQTVGVMADYFLSKRTDVYVVGAYQHVGGDTTGSVLDFAYVPFSAGVSSNRNQLFARVAIRHKF
ncbi:porin [Paraburkholderia phymatum]|uniref:Porin n=1 Tax=Paraburkholderia phymatum TaxID=148447 RepID=A0ACC6UBN9_9BURK